MSVAVTLLGTGNPLPHPTRAGAATLVTAGDRQCLVDAGRGVCLRLAAAGSLPILLDRVLLTHLHSDHLCDLNDVVTTHWVMSQAPTPLLVVGPVGTREVVDGLLAMLRHDVAYRTAHHADLTWAPIVDVHEVGAGELSSTPDGVRDRRGRHRPPTRRRPRSPTGSSTAGGPWSSPATRGPCASLDELVEGADVYVQTVLREDLVRLVPLQRFVDTVDYHSTVEEAAQTAQRAGVGTLVLTHQIPTPAPGAADEWLALARAHFDGEVVFGEDLTAV